MIYVCSAKVKSINPALTTLDLDGYQFLSKEYRAPSKTEALKGFTQYLQTNKSFVSFKNVIVK